MRRECAEVYRLERSDEVEWQAGLCGDSRGLATVVRGVTELLGHLPMSMMAIERRVLVIREGFVLLKLAGPWEMRPAQARCRRVRIAGVAGVEIGGVAEEVPFDGANDEAFT